MEMHGLLPQQGIGIKDIFSDFKEDGGDTEGRRLQREWEGNQRGEWREVLIKIHHIHMHETVKE